MGGASLGCPLAEEAEAEEAEEEGMVPFQQPFQVLSLGASAGQREAVPERVCAGPSFGLHSAQLAASRHRCGI